MRASTLDFGARLANRCKVFSGNSPKAASILDFIHRLANRCSFLPGNASCTAVILDLRGSIWESLQHHRRSSEELPACSARRGNELPRPILIFVAAKRNGSDCSGSQQRTSATDSIFRCRKGEWPACSSSCGSNLPRLILIFVAAKENGSACRTPLPHRCIDS